MKSNKPTKIIEKWLYRNREKWIEWWMEDDYFDAAKSGKWSIWVALNDGFTLDGTMTIHEANTKSFLESAEKVVDERESCW